MHLVAALSVNAFLPHAPRSLHRPRNDDRGCRPTVAIACTTTRLPDSVKEIWTARFTPFGTEDRQTKRPPIQEQDVVENWEQLIRAYNGEEMALQACSQNPTILHPLYTSPPSVISSSKEALLEVFDGDEKEVIDVMLKNPAVLQCGRSLSTQPASEIQRFAGVRSVLDRVPPQVSLLTLVLVLLTGALNIVLTRGTESESTQALLSLTKPILGTAGAGVFIGTLVLVAKSSKDEAQGKRVKEAGSEDK